MPALATLRGNLSQEVLPPGVIDALRTYDELRQAHGYEGADMVARDTVGPLQRLTVGMRCLSYRSVCRIATFHSHVCPTYVRQHLSTLTTLMGLFWWDDGGSTVRERLLRLAWEKGGRS